MKRFFRRRALEVRSHAWRRGVFGGDHRWLALYGTIVTVGIIRRIANPKHEVQRIVLGRGQTIVIADTGSEHSSSQP